MPFYRTDTQTGPKSWHKGRVFHQQSDEHATLMARDLDDHGNSIRCYSLNPDLTIKDLLFSSAMARKGAYK